MVKGDSEPREKTGVETSIDERRAAASSPNFGKSDRVGTHPRFGCAAIADGFHPDGHAGSSSELSAAHAAPELCNGSKDSPAPLPDASVTARLRLRQMTHRYLSGCPIAFGSREEPPRRPRPEPAIHPHFWAMDFVSSSFSPPFGLGLISPHTM